MIPLITIIGNEQNKTKDSFQEVVKLMTNDANKVPNELNAYPTLSPSLKIILYKIYELRKLRGK